ncbi:phage portal protein [Microbacterium paludicola]|uniref:phage portal protein n=1 Tax=Microbacterium paludicola TaxID=300019 RepID=UPI0011A93100|nr:phage portal protein [Microbacterium paludicola]
MGILDFFRTKTPQVVPTAAGHSLVSPWSDSNAAQLVWAEHFGVAEDAVTRQTALQVPAIARARALLVGAIADLPIVAYRGNERLARQPAWVHRTDGPLSIWHRNAATIEDLLLYGVSLWARRNGADGYPLDFVRVPRERWDVDMAGRVLVDGKPAPANEVVVIPGPGEGLLTTAQNTIRGARAIDRAWQARVRTPIPPTLFQQTERKAATSEEVRAMLEGWSKARRDPESSAVGFVPYGINPVFPGLDASGTQDLFIQGRNALRLDIANLTNIPASLLDGSVATASLTYQTQEGQRSSFQEQTMRYWLSPIEHRLSMDDVTPSGQSVRFDLAYVDHTLPSPQTPTSADEAPELEAPATSGPKTEITPPRATEADREGLV